MASESGFSLFLPALLTLYCSSQRSAGIKQAIEYSAHRFYSVHKNVFVFQALDAISRMVHALGNEGAEFAKHGYTLLSSLKGNPSSEDAAGIHDFVKAQENETELAYKVEEMPQLFITSFRKDSKFKPGALHEDVTMRNIERFPPHDIIRMVLTVIADDPSNERTQRFLCLLLHFSEGLYNASTRARIVLKDALNALGRIIASTSPGKALKAQESTHLQAVVDGLRKDENMMGVGQEQLNNKPNATGDMDVLRAEYLLLVASYAKLGGDLREVASGVRFALDIVISSLRELTTTTSLSVQPVQQLVDALAESFLKREDPDHSAIVLRDLAPIINAYGTLFDMTVLLKTLITLSAKPMHANNQNFSTAVVHHVCAAVLQICETAASTNMLFRLKYRETFVILLGRSVCLLNTDILKEIERREMLPEFLAGIVLPFIISLRTTKQLSSETQWQDSVRHDTHQRVWVRLFFYTLSLFEPQSHPATNTERNRLTRATSAASHADDDDRDGTERRSRKWKQKYERTMSSTQLAASLVLFKAVVVRGQADISSILPSAWSHAYGVLSRFLQEGNADFAVNRGLGSSVHTPLTSPLQSPISPKHLGMPRPFSGHKRTPSQASEKSEMIQSLAYSPSSPSDPPTGSLSIETKEGSTRKSSAAPRLVDYLTWSLLEFTCLCRTPLTIQFRTFTHERMYHLNEALKPGISSPISPITRPRLSMSARPISTLYSKPRRGSHAGGSGGGTAASTAAPSPAGSPRLLAIDAAFARHKYGQVNSIYSVPGSPILDRFEGQQHALRSGVRIVHLGPNAELPRLNISDTSHSPTRLSGDSRRRKDDSKGTISNLRDLAKSSVLLSPALVAATYGRIRTVQARMGYSTLNLPCPEERSKATKATNDPFLDDPVTSPDSVQSAELSNAIRSLTAHAAIAKCIEESLSLLEALEQRQVGDTSEDMLDLPPSPHQQFAPPNFTL